AVSGTTVVDKVVQLTTALHLFNPEYSLEFNDFIVYEDGDLLRESPLLAQLDPDTLRKFQELFTESIRQRLLVGQKKASFFKFLRTSSIKGVNYLRDIL